MTHNDTFRLAYKVARDVRREIEAILTYERQHHHMQTQAQLDAVIAALPGQIQTAVVTAATPVIAAALAAGQSGEDFTTEVNALTAAVPVIAAGVATALQALLPTATPTPAVK